MWKWIGIWMLVVDVRIWMWVLSRAFSFQKIHASLYVLRATQVILVGRTRQQLCSFLTPIFLTDSQNGARRKMCWCSSGNILIPRHGSLWFSLQMVRRGGLNHMGNNGGALITSCYVCLYKYFELAVAVQRDECHSHQPQISAFVLILNLLLLLSLLLLLLLILLLLLLPVLLQSPVMTTVCLGLVR